MAFVLPFCFFYQLSVFCRDVLMRAALFLIQFFIQWFIFQPQSVSF